MSDLRPLLDLAAGRPPGSVPMEAIRRRRARLVMRRRAAGLATAAMLAIVAAVAVPRVAAGPVPTAGPTRLSAIGDLPAGPYRASVMGQPLDFTVPNGPPWVALILKPDRLLLGSGPGVRVDVLHWTAVHTHTPQGRPLAATIPPPSNLTDWITSHPAVLLLTPPEATTLAGRPAHRLRITVRADYFPDDAPDAVGCGRLPDCILLAEAPGRSISLDSRSSLTLVIQDEPGASRLIAVVTSPDQDSFAEARADLLIDSFGTPAPGS